MYKTILFFYLAVFATPMVSAQSILTPSLGDTLDISFIESRNQIDYKAGTDTAITAIVTESYESGQIKLRRSVVNGLAEGLWMEWYESGIPRYMAEWKQGMGHGTWIYFHENGQISSRETVVDDVLHGISESWYASGQKKTEGHLHEGAKHGVWKYWAPDGSLERTEDFVYGTSISTNTEYKNTK